MVVGMQTIMQSHNPITSLQLHGLIAGYQGKIKCAFLLSFIALITLWSVNADHLPVNIHSCCVMQVPLVKPFRLMIMPAKGVWVPPQNFGRSKTTNYI